MRKLREKVALICGLLLVSLFPVVSPSLVEWKTRVIVYFDNDLAGEGYYNYTLENVFNFTDAAGNIFTVSNISFSFIYNFTSGVNYAQGFLYRVVGYGYEIYRKYHIWGGTSDYQINGVLERIYRFNESIEEYWHGTIKFKDEEVTKYAYTRRNYTIRVLSKTEVYLKDIDEVVEAFPILETISSTGYFLTKINYTNGVQMVEEIFPNQTRVKKLYNNSILVNETRSTYRYYIYESYIHYYYDTKDIVVKIVHETILSVVPENKILKSQIVRRTKEIEAITTPITTLIEKITKNLKTIIITAIIAILTLFLTYYRRKRRKHSI